MRPGRLAMLGVVPYAVVVIVLLLVPALGILQLSFENSAGASDGLQLRNYARILEPYYFTIIWRTIKLALVAAVFELIFALPVAYMLARATPGMKAFLTLCVMIPLMTSVVVKAFGWYILLSEEGSLTSLIHASGIYDLPVMGTQFAVVLAMVEFGLPFMILSLATAFEKVPRNLEEAGLNLHASPLRVFWYILLPLIKPGVLSGFLLCFGVSASAYVIPAMLGGTKVKMAAQVIFDDVMVAFNWPGAAAVSIVLLVVLSAILYISLVLGRAKNEART